MNDLQLALQLALAAVFLVAAIAKASTPAQTRGALAGFGVPAVAAPLLAVALPLAELALALALLPIAWPRAAALAALVALAAFTGVIGVHLARGHRIDCRCFGEIRPRPIGAHSVARNALLMLAASLVAWRGPGATSNLLSEWFWRLPAVDIALLSLHALTLGVLMAGGVFLTHRMRAIASIAARLTEIEGQLLNVPPPRGLPVGAFAPSFELPNTRGERRGLRELLAPGFPPRPPLCPPGVRPVLAGAPQGGRVAEPPRGAPPLRAHYHPRQ